MTFPRLLRWLIPIVIAGCAAGVVYFFVTPTFSHDYKQLTERVEVGLKYTNREDQTVYFRPYIENPNPSSNLTLTHSGNFITVCVLDENGEIIKNAVTIPKEETPSGDLLQTTLSPGERAKNTNYYKVTFSENADRIQLTFNGEVNDEYGSDDVEETIEVDIDYLNI